MVACAAVGEQYLNNVNMFKPVLVGPARPLAKHPACALVERSHDFSTGALVKSGGKA